MYKNNQFVDKQIRSDDQPDIHNIHMRCDQSFLLLFLSGSNPSFIVPEVWSQNKTKQPNRDHFWLPGTSYSLFPAQLWVNTSWQKK